MSQHVETMRAALHEIGERDLAEGLQAATRPGGSYRSPHLREPVAHSIIRKASLIAHISLNGHAAAVRCSAHRIVWLAGESRPPEWDQCAKVAAWQMLHDPTTVCASTPRPI